MKILLCHNYYRIRAGEARGFESEIELLTRHGHQVMTYTRDNREIDAMSLWRRFRLLWEMLFSRRTYREIRDLIRNDRPDVAHVHNIYPLISPALFYVLKKHGVPIIQVLHNYRFLCVNGLLLDNRKRICEKCLQGAVWPAVRGRCYRQSAAQSLALAFCLKVHRRLRSYDKIDLFVAPSRFMRQKMIQAGFSAERIVMKPHHLDLERTQPVGCARNYAVYMGRLSQEKGVWTLVKAFQSLKRYRLEILGEGPLQEDIATYCRENGLTHITLHGFIGSEKRFEILGNAAFLVFPSEWYENCPFTLLESLALGVPVLATPLGGVGEIVEEGRSGLFFCPGDIDDLKEKVISMFSDRERLISMRDNARQTARKRFSPDLAYGRLQEIYARLGVPIEKEEGHAHQQ